MAQIPLGQFSTSGAAQAGPAGAAQYRPGAVGDAVQGLAATIGNAAESFGNIELQQQHAMARAKASDAMLDYEIANSDLTQKLQTDIQSGTVPYDQAMAQYNEGVGKLNPPTVEGLPPDMQEALVSGTKRANHRGLTTIQATVQNAQQADFKGRFGTVLDKLGKLAGTPDADIEQINTRAEAYRPLAEQAGIPAGTIDKTLQDFKDKNWANQASNAMMMARNDPNALEKLAENLSNADGFYAGKLDTDKRNAILNSVLSRRQMLLYRSDRQQDRRDAAGLRAVAQIDQQIASGVPATPQQWTAWADSVKGTSSEQDYRDRIADEQEVQAVLRKPPNEQAAYVQQKQAELKNEGGSVRAQANVQRLAAAVATNVKQLQDSPLLYNQSRNDDPVMPLDANAFMGGQQQVADEMQRRAQIIGAMQKQYGSELVKPNLLLPQEVTDLQGLLSKATPDNQLKVLGNLRRVSADDGVYNAVMKQLSPKDPVLAFTGQVIGRDSWVVSTSHWFKPDETFKSDDVARAMLEGNRLLTSGGKSDDGQKYPLPGDAKFTAAFGEAFGDLFPNRPDALQQAMAVAKAYYTGKAAQTGKLQTDDVDGDLMRESVRATIGDTPDVNGKGQVVAPWGMPADTFENAAERAFDKAVDRSKLPGSLKSQFSTFGLQNRSGNLYYVTKGREYLHDAAGNPVLLDINDGIVPDDKAAP